MVEYGVPKPLSISEKYHGIVNVTIIREGMNYFFFERIIERAILCFVGSALKSVIGVSLESDINKVNIKN